MFDITITDLTYGQFTFIHILYLIIVLLYWRKFVTEYDYDQGPQPLFLFLIFIYLIFAYDGGDFYHYAENVQTNNHASQEYVYQLISDFVGHNYLLFRIIVWGGSFVLFFKTAERFLLDPYKVSFFLVAMYIAIFDYARATLGMAIFFYGLSYICMPVINRKILSYILGSGLIAASVFFHRSMALSVAMTFMIFVPLNKKTIILLLAAFVSSAPVLNYMFQQFSSGVVGSQELNEKIEEYSRQTFNDGFSKLEWIRRYIEYSTFFIPFGLVTMELFSEENPDEQEIGMRKLYKVTLGLLLLAVSTLLIDLETFTLFYRYLYMSMIPICLLFCYSRERYYISPFIYQLILYVGIGCKMFGYAKRLMGNNLV